MNITNWLRKTPQPVAVLADDKRIEVGKNVRAFRDLTQTIKAMDPGKLTCLDASGNVLRSIVLEDGDDKESSAPATPEQSDLQLFARLLAEGYEHGRKANQPIIDSAMQFVERQGVRLAKAEAEIERLRAHIHKLNLNIAELSSIPVTDGGDESLMGALVAGAIQSGALSVPGAQQQQPGVTPLKQGAKK